MTLENSKIGFICGAVGGGGKFLLQIHATVFMWNLAGAVVTAVVCGMAGVAGKELYQWCKTKIKNRKRS